MLMNVIITHVAQMKFVRTLLDPIRVLVQQTSAEVLATASVSTSCFVNSGPQLPKGCGCIRFLSPMHKKIPDSYSKREWGNPGNSGL